MEEALEKARSKDTKERMAGVERLHQLLESSSKTLSSSEVTSLVDCCLDLLKDNNFRVSQGALLALASAAVLSGDHLKLHFNALLPAVVERLGDGKQPVRDSARRLLLTLMEVSSPTIIVERAGSYAWMHKSWRVREEFARTVTSAIGLFASTELPLQRAILPPILQMLNDPNPGVREAAITCIEEMYTQIGPQFREELQRHHLPPSMVKDINAKLERIEPKNRSPDGLSSKYAANDNKTPTLNPKRSSPKAKTSSREVSLFGGDSDVTEKPVEPIKVYSEKELMREFEKIGATLVPEKDWSVRISAMQRVEGLIVGGAADYPCFRGLIKQLVNPLSTQLADRRSTIVKQACHLLCFLSKELLGDFESCAEMFIPVLFKLVVITVLVIAESADNCIKTMLRNCKVARSLSRIADCAKTDRNSVLRARCCEYSVLILEYWADAPEIQRSADLYEDLIRCCVADAMSEVRSTARACYRMFAKTWPERSRRLFLSFDPVIQRIINEEDGGIHKRHASPSIRDRSNPSQINANSTPSGYATSAIVAMDRTTSLPSAAPAASLSAGLYLPQVKPITKNAERSLESVLHASKQKVTAIESMLRGLDINGRARSSSLDLGVDPPPSRDPPYPHASSNSSFLDSAATSSSSLSRNNNRNGGLALSDIITQIQASKDTNKLLPHESATSSSSSLASYSAKRLSERSSSHIDRHHHQQYIETPYKDYHNNSHIPNFQRPLLRKNVSARKSSGRRRSFDDSQLSLGETPDDVDGPDSLTDALTEGLNPSSDWNVRVSAFNYLRSLLEQGPRGIQEVTGSFEKVMRLFFQHLDDPHHKVAQAALTTLADLIPACRKPFEHYMERILPHVFSRLIDPKELVRQPCSLTLEIVSKTYGTDSLLPAFLRSLDEQRSPKAKLAVIDYAIASFKKHAMSTEGSGNSGILKLWLAKLTPLVYDKNTKLKEAATTCIISVFTYYDPTAVLNYILSLSVEEQNSLRRALKQRTPRIEVDLMNFIQTKKERQRPRSSYDPSDNVGSSSDDGYIVSSSKKNHFYGNEHLYQGHDGNLNNEVHGSRFKDHKYSPNTSTENLGSWTNRFENVSRSADTEASFVPRISINGSDHAEATAGAALDNDASPELESVHSDLTPLKINSCQDTGVSIAQVLHMICNGNDECSTETKRSGLQQLVEASVANDKTVWTKYFNQILTVVLEVLDDSDPSVRELSISLMVEMVNNQKDSIEDSVEIIIEKLLHVTKDSVLKVANEAEHCLTVVLAQYDPFRCLSVIVPLLVNEDEKTLVTCINCLTKLVGRLSQDELMAQLSSFLPALFEAFGNQSADVRKTVVFCLVDIYILLGKAFLPYLEGLNSTQLRLVTIYANRISQARTGTPIDANHD
jgi:CLIP-associating protein 1/2